MRDIFEFMQSDDAKKIKERVAELKKLYDISEAEMHLINQLALTIKISMDMSPELTIKLMRALTAMFEMIHEVMPKDVK